MKIVGKFFLFLPFFHALLCKCHFFLSTNLYKFSSLKIKFKYKFILLGVKCFEFQLYLNKSQMSLVKICERMTTFAWQYVKFNWYSCYFNGIISIQRKRIIPSLFHLTSISWNCMMGKFLKAKHKMQLTDKSKKICRQSIFAVSVIL